MKQLLIKSKFFQRLSRKLFEFLQFFCLHIMPDYFYSSIPLHYTKQQGFKEFLPNYLPHKSNEFGLFKNTPERHFPTSTYFQVIQ